MRKVLGGDVGEPNPHHSGTHRPCGNYLTEHGLFRMQLSPFERETQGALRRAPTHDRLPPPTPLRTFAPLAVSLAPWEAKYP